MNKLKTLTIKTINYKEAKDKIAWSNDEYTHYIVKRDDGKIEYYIDIDLFEYIYDYKKDKEACIYACNEFLRNEYFIIHNRNTLIDFKKKYYKTFKNELFRELYLIYKFMYRMIYFKNKKPIDI